MPTNYTGVPTAAQSPGAAPAWGVPPIFALPADGDLLNVSSILQSLKAAADQLAFLLDGKGRAFFGTGADGDVTVSGSTGFTQPKACRNLTVTASGVLELNAPLWVSDTLTVQSGGRIHRDGQAGTNPAGGLGFDSGTAPLVFMRAGTAGGTGGASSGANGGAGTSFTGGGVVNAGLGGAGGASASFAGGAGGQNSTGPSGGQAHPDPYRVVPGMVIATGVDTPSFGLVAAGGGTGGGAGAGQSGATGGGGGGGGGFIWIAARKIVLATTTCITAKGGAGGVSSGGGAGGGGGGGGRICLFYGVNGGSLLASSVVDPGAGGAGGANPGLVGLAGQLFQQQVN